MKILIVDDHAILRQGLRSLLEEESMEVVGEAADGKEGVELAARLQPDLVIMDLDMPGLDGMEALRLVQENHPGIKVVILSMHGSKAYVRQALGAGASGYILKDGAFDELLLAIRSVMEGKLYLCSSVQKPVIEGYLKISPESEAQAIYRSLSSREKSVFCLVVKGFTRKQVAEYLHIEPKTVDQHKANIKKKLKIQEEEGLKEFARLLELT